MSCVTAAPVERSVLFQKHESCRGRGGRTLAYRHWTNICLGRSRGRKWQWKSKLLPYCTVCGTSAPPAGLSRCWEQIMLPEVVVHNTRDWEKPSVFLRRLQETWQPSSFPLSLRWDELVILKWKHECDVPLPTTVPTPSSNILPMTLNRAPLSVFSSPIPEDWLLIKHATTHPL